MVAVAILELGLPAVLSKRVLYTVLTIALNFHTLFILFSVKKKVILLLYAQVR